MILLFLTKKTMTGKFQSFQGVREFEIIDIRESFRLFLSGYRGYVDIDGVGKHMLLYMR